MIDLKESREEISAIDAEIAKLFEKRMAVCKNIALYKKETGIPIRDLRREKELIERNCGFISDPEIESYYVRFIRNTIDISCSYQSRLLEGIRVAFSGEKGAFAHIASKKLYPEGQIIAYPDFISAYRATETGEADCVVLPIENSYTGEVGTVMDLLFSGTLFVNQVIDIPVSHCLIGNDGADFSTVKRVISHPQALGQCSSFITRNDLSTESFSNTALAAQHVKESGRTDIAAIGSHETAEAFGMNIIERDIQDKKANTTRFASFARTRNSSCSASENDNFILVFTVKNEAGALAQALDIIGIHGYNMRSLRSRPMKELQWRYYFYVEAEGNVNNKNGENMLKELSAICDRLRLAGSYNADNSVR